MKHETSLAAANNYAAQLKNNGSRSVAEQERDRRLGFAAAYQQRLSSLLWSKDSPSTQQKQDGMENKGIEGESILTTSWRHLLGLPNLLLMPTLGPSRTRALESEEIRQGNAAKSLSPPEEVTGSPPLTTPSSPGSAGSASSLSLSPSDSSFNAGEASEFRRRGVMNPLEGDSDVSAYVSGLGLPIDPDLELSSVVHLQTFRTKHTSKSRRGSLEKPISILSGEIGQHRRAYSENRVEPTLQSLRSEALFRGMFPAKKAKAVVAISIAEEGKGSSSRSSSSEEEQASSSIRSCSRPAVQAPVPGDFSAYSSSESEEEEEEDGGQSGRRRIRGRNGRGRTKRNRRRSSSPPNNRKQCAIGLFDSKRHGRSHNDATEEEDISNVIRVRSSPNLTRIASKTSQRRLRKDDRGRAGSVKVVPASLPRDHSNDEIGTVPPVNGHNRSTSVPSQSFSSQSSLGLGLPSVSLTTGGRACMVSNGAHLLMLSLELEMMRRRKITGSLKPRWLKARFRSESFVKGGALSEDLDERSGAPSSRKCSMPTSKPRLGSSLRYEVQPN